MGGKGSGQMAITGLGKLSNGEITASVATQLRISLVGCPHRGSTTCMDCPLADYIAKECDYRCDQCDAVERCPCGQDRRVTCTCGGRLEILPLHYQGGPRWAHQCQRCGTIWSVGGWHHQADEFREGRVEAQSEERCDLSKMGQDGKKPVLALSGGR